MPALVADAALGDARQQRLHRRLQVDHQVGLGRIHVQARGHLLVQRHLGGVERQAREQPVLLE